MPSNLCTLLRLITSADHSFIQCHVTFVLSFSYTAFFYFSHLRYTIMLWYFLLKTISLFSPVASVETTLPSCSHLSLFLFTKLLSIPSIPCSDLLALPYILCTWSIQSVHAKIFNGLFLAKSQNLYSVFISATWQLPSILPPFSFSWNITLPWWFNFLLVLLQTIYSLILSPQESLFNPTNKTIVDSMVTSSTSQFHLSLFC